MIYAETSELRDVSVIPDALMAVAVELPGLEAATGADFLICTDEISECKSPPGKIILRQRCESGTLIQRKSGGDLLSSIHKLPEILARMQEWDPSPWLVVTRISPGPRDTVKVTGSRRRNKWRWSSVSGAFDAWQDRGGCLKILEDDHDLTAWFQAREARVREWEINPEKLVAHRPIIVKSRKQRVKKVEPSWYTTRMAWPKGIGPSQLASLARYIAGQGRPPTLANAISLTCSEEVLKIKGWGKVSMNSVREWYQVSHSIRNMVEGSGSWCMIYDFHEGDLLLEGENLYEVTKHPLDRPIPEGAHVYTKGE